MTRLHLPWRNFVLYYGTGLEDALTSFDLIILESRAQKASFIKRLNHLGKTPVAYISGFEYPHDWPDAEKKRLRYGLATDSWWRPSWTDNYLMDLRHEGWRELVAAEMQRIMERGYQGVFLDTLGVCQMPELVQLSPSLPQELLQAAADTIAYLRRCFPEAVIIQNCGLNQLKEMAAPYIDAVCWESFRLDLVEGPDTDAWSLKQVAELEQLSAKHGISILLLAEDGMEYERLPFTSTTAARMFYDGSCHRWRNAAAEYFPHQAELERFARQHHFLIYKAPRHYVAGVYTPDREINHSAE